MRLSRLPVYILVALLPACSVTDLAFVFRPDVEQGTIIEADSVAQLEPGMTRRQVQFLMGSPTIEDPLRTDRWDYIHRVQTGGGRVTTHETVTLYFDDDILIRGEGSLVAPDSPLAAGSS